MHTGWVSELWRPEHILVTSTRSCSFYKICQAQQHFQHLFYTITLHCLLLFRLVNITFSTEMCVLLSSSKQDMKLTQTCFLCIQTIQLSVCVCFNFPLHVWLFSNVCLKRNNQKDITHVEIIIFNKFIESRSQFLWLL